MEVMWNWVGSYYREEDGVNGDEGNTVIHIGWKTSRVVSDTSFFQAGYEVSDRTSRHSELEGAHGG